jgi:branched-chain amino acid transport system substrate-binding protein
MTTFAAAAVAAFAAAAAAAPTGAVSCKQPIELGMMAPLTGPAASAGADQLHWAQFFVQQWNAKRNPKIRLAYSDTQLDPSKAAAVAEEFGAKTTLVGVIGPADWREVVAAAPALESAGLAFVSASATPVWLTDGSRRGFFYRVVPNDAVQGATVAAYMQRRLGVTRGSSVMIVDDQEPYSIALADIVESTLRGRGVIVQRESVSQEATDFSPLVAKADTSTKVVFLPFRLASHAQLFAQQLRAQGGHAVVFGSDATFDRSQFNVSGSYVSFFAPDVTTIRQNAAIVRAFRRAFPGPTSPFGPPAYVAVQVYVNAIAKACSDRVVTRAEVRRWLTRTNLPVTLLGGPLAFTPNGDVAGTPTYHVFWIRNGRYVPVAVA